MSIVELNENKLLLTSIAGLLVLTSVILKNGTEEIGLFKNIGTLAGLTSFIIGWTLMAYSISFNPNKSIGSLPRMNAKTIQAFSAIALIIGSTIAMKVISGSVPIVYTLLFIVGWLLLGFTIGNFYSYVAVLIALGTLIVVLPLQRANCVVDGPGMSLLTLSFVLLAFANSI